MALNELLDLFRDAPFTWCIAGGHALELAVGESWRSHDDIDVSVPRRELASLHLQLDGWDLHVAAAGVLTPWDGRELTCDRHENNIWARRRGEAPWALDIVLSEGDEHAWWSRRDPSHRLPWGEAVLDCDGIPYLAPQAELLMKSKDPRPKDWTDASKVIPTLTPEQRAWLRDTLPPDHPWRGLLAAS